MILGRAVRAIILIVAGLVFVAAGVVPADRAGAEARPQELLVYYGWPSRINGAADPGAAAAELGRYGFVALGSGVEDPAHPDHARTGEVLADPAMAGTFVFGYVNLGVTNGFLSLDEVRSRIDEWRVLGADAILFDAFGYDFGVTRERQNDAVGYAHSLGMPVMANAWAPADAFGSTADPDHNPLGLATLLGAGDYYLSESYRIRLGEYQPEELWRIKADLLAAYRAELGFSVLSVTTNAPSDVYSEEKFFEAWEAAAAYGHLATGWGEYLFSADDGLAPYRARPAPTDPPPPAPGLPPDPVTLPSPAEEGDGGIDLPAMCRGEQATVVGTAGDDRLIGTDGPDIIAGLGGNDVIDGLGGDDLICGGGGDDVIRAGPGDDRLVGGPGSDDLWGDAGADVVQGGGAGDRLIGGPEDDVLKGNGGDDLLQGGEGNDRLAGGAGADVLLGGAGDDRLFGRRGDDFLQGDEGFDRARGGPQLDQCTAERAFKCES